MAIQVPLALLAVVLGGDPPQPARAEQKKAEPLEHVLYEDESWTHIGDGRFSPQSNGFSDLTLKSSGKELTVKIVLEAKAIAEIADSKWKSAVLAGSVIGNDTGMHGNTTATVVTLDGKQVGEITKSGLFRVHFDKKRLTSDPKTAMIFTITAGQNSAADRDDQELGLFKLLLSDQDAQTPKDTGASEKSLTTPGK